MVKITSNGNSSMAYTSDDENDGDDEEILSDLVILLKISHEIVHLICYSKNYSNSNRTTSQCKTIWCTTIQHRHFIKQNRKHFPNMKYANLI